MKMKLNFLNWNDMIPTSFVFLSIFSCWKTVVADSSFHKSNQNVLNNEMEEKFDTILNEFRTQWIKKESPADPIKISKNHTDPGSELKDTRYHRIVSKRDLPFIYQSPPSVACDQASSTSIVSGSRAVDFASFALGILTLVININNNINNNNNNNNNINLNAADSSNIVANFNTNNANQVNIMPPGRRRRSLTNSTALLITSLLKALLNNDRKSNLDESLLRNLKSSTNPAQNIINKAIFQHLKY